MTTDGDELEPPRVQPSVYGIRGHLVATPEQLDAARALYENLPPITWADLPDELKED